MVNWEPEAKTTLSDEEVIHKEKNGKLFYLNYQLADGSDTVTIATTRPETILGDTAICVNPEDERFAHLIGKKAIVPLADREIPIIGDSYVDMEFGTGCLKVTPAHDVNDKKIGETHNLEIIDILNDDGTLNEHGLHYAGKDRFAVRKEIAVELEEKGFLIKTEDYKTSVGTSERTGTVIEPKLSVQWFLKMDDLCKPALESVMNDTVKLIPGKFKNTYRHWMENIHNWNISRQLHWGHRIPAWYYGEGDQDFVVAMNAEDALAKSREKTGNASLTNADIRQDEDVLDTWFSSWLWPIAVFDGVRNPENEEINYYYPTNDLVTAPEILFFWVARMIISGYEYRDERPFENVYLTGIVRDKQGRKMSKSLGNSPDPIGLMEKYSADGVRVGMLLTSPAGNDLPFDESLCEQGRNFANKVWNALRLIKGWEIDTAADQPASAALANAWFEATVNEAITEIEHLFKQYRLSEALMAIYKLVWDEFCGWYLEMIKPAYGSPIDALTLEQAIGHFESMVKLMHPFMPFITEEIWHRLRDREESDFVIVASWPEVTAPNPKLVEDFEKIRKAIVEIRQFRAKHNIPNKETLDLVTTGSADQRFDSIIIKLTNLTGIQDAETKPEKAYGFVVGSTEYFIPTEDLVDSEAEREKITKELEYTKGFLKGVMKKLSNERFVSGAPEQVVANERKKQADAEERITLLEAQLKNL
jgi:valyl-tRNA synthetase